MHTCISSSVGLYTYPDDEACILYKILQKFSLLFFYTVRDMRQIALHASNYVSSIRHVTSQQCAGLWIRHSDTTQSAVCLYCSTQANSAIYPPGMAYTGIISWQCSTIVGSLQVARKFSQLTVNTNKYHLWNLINLRLAGRNHTL
jgi:hypothetical protein